MEPVNDRSNADKGRRARLRNLAKKDFPGGKIHDPYTAAWLNLIGGAEIRDLQATIRISPYEWPDGAPEPMQTFQDIWVLWDTGAQVSQILSTQLHDNIKEDENGAVQLSGFAVAKVKYVQLLIHVRLWKLLIIFPPRFPGVQQEIEANIALRPNMPNNTTFIILGQQVSAMQYNASRSRSNTLPSILLRHCSTPSCTRSKQPSPYKIHGDLYSLVYYRDPVTPDAPLVPL